MEWVLIHRLQWMSLDSSLLRLLLPKKCSIWEILNIDLCCQSSRSLNLYMMRSRMENPWRLMYKLLRCITFKRNLKNQRIAQNLLDVINHFSVSMNYEGWNTQFLPRIATYKQNIVQLKLVWSMIKILLTIWLLHLVSRVFHE